MIATDLFEEDIKNLNSLKSKITDEIGIVDKDTKIYIAGHRGMVGSAVKRKLEQQGFRNLVYRTSSELDLRNQQAVQEFFEKEQPDVVIDAAARVGGILNN